MTAPMTREQAAAAVAAAAAERDSIQANLLDLDGSFGRRMLAGATLTGESQRRWDAAAADLATLWQIFHAYAAVVDGAAGLLAGGRRPADRDLTQITTMLTGASVELTRTVPLGRRDLTETGRSDLTVAAAVREMKQAFARVAGVVAAAESVWNETADGLSEVGTQLATAKEQLAGLGDDEVTAALAAAEAELDDLRDVLNSDPLALWQGGRADTIRLERLREQSATVAARAAGIARLRADAQRQISAAAAAVAAAEAAREDAAAARVQAEAKIAAADLPPPAGAAEVAGLEARLATLDKLRAAGRWARLAAELDTIGAAAADATQRYRAEQRAAAGVLSRRDELRGLLDAYRAKAARLGAAEDIGLSERYQEAHGLLWTAPCDLTSAAAAVTTYQQAVSALNGRRRSQ
jgi:chromosome segregation ATPase